MRIAISGSRGMIGTALIERLSPRGHTIHRLVRKPIGTANDPAHICWEPEQGRVEGRKLEGLDAVVHLAGENVASGPWTREKKRRITDSRVKGTDTLCRALAGLSERPRVLVSASAIGYYGDRGDETMIEQARPGETYLAEVARKWEKAAAPAEEAGLRVVKPRIGLVLSTRGGALPKMLTPFKLGLGGRVGDGRQWMSWITLDDLAAALEHALMTEGLSGPTNAVAPNPATNAEFTETLGRVLRRPTFMKIPGPALRTLMGEMADSMLLASCRCVPHHLEASGFLFQHPQLEPALRAVLGKE